MKSSLYRIVTEYYFAFIVSIVLIYVGIFSAIYYNDASMTQPYWEHLVSDYSKSETNIEKQIKNLSDALVNCEKSDILKINESILILSTLKDKGISYRDITEKYVSGQRNGFSFLITLEDKMNVVNSVIALVIVMIVVNMAKQNGTHSYLLYQYGRRKKIIMDYCIGAILLGLILTIEIIVSSLIFLSMKTGIPNVLKIIDNKAVVIDFRCYFILYFLCSFFSLFWVYSFFFCLGEIIDNLYIYLAMAMVFDYAIEYNVASWGNAYTSGFVSYWLNTDITMTFILAKMIKVLLLVLLIITTWLVCRKKKIKIRCE